LGIKIKTGVENMALTEKKMSETFKLSTTRPKQKIVKLRGARQIALDASAPERAQHLSLIRGTILELVRRDGRDLTARQLTTLLTVYLHEEVYSVSMLADMLNISRPGVTRILDRLVEATLVSRAEDAEDRRRVLIYRTREGSRYVDTLGTVAVDVAGAARMN
jgi:DNA-binding MarR family transcriptional regulator